MISFHSSQKKKVYLKHAAFAFAIYFFVCWTERFKRVKEITIRLSKSVKSYREQKSMKIWVNVCRKWKEQIRNQVIKRICISFLLKGNISVPIWEIDRQRECCHQLDSSKILQQSGFVIKKPFNEKKQRIKKTHTSPPKKWTQSYYGKYLTMDTLKRRCVLKGSSKQVILPALITI